MAIKVGSKGHEGSKLTDLDISGKHVFSQADRTVPPGAASATRR